MASIKTTTPILGSRFYHIFNRGINRYPIFFTEANYVYFLNLVQKYLVGYMDILAYVLLHNHFHLIVKVKDELEIKNLNKKTQSVSNQPIQTKTIKVTDEEEIGKMVSKQLRRFFTAYAMAINKQENRVGSLFDPKFKRLEITTQDYLEYVIFYVHYNPEKHGYINNFKNYRYSSYKATAGYGKTKIDRKFVLEIFGGKDEFINYHSVVHEERTDVILE